MKLINHRGSKEIGGSCVEISTDKSRILLDFGMPLVDSGGNDFNFNKYKSLPISELISQKVLPDIPDLYAQVNQSPVDAILISHPHFDHYGLTNYVRKDVPFCLGAATLDIINITSVFTPNKINLNNTVIFEKSIPFEIGDIKATPYWMDHSAFDSYAFLIEADGKKIFYSGDFRSHGRKSKAFYCFCHNAPKNVDYLLMEGTTLGRSNSRQQTEDEIEEEFVNVFRASNKTNLIYNSGQNIDRLVSIFRACRRTNHILVMDYYIATVLESLSKYASLPYPSPEFEDIKVIFPFRMNRKFEKEGKLEVLYKFKKFKITKEEISAQPENKVIIVRPTMAEDLQWIKNIDGGNLIYSMWDGYLKKPNLKKFIDYLEQVRGFSTIKLHSSGHSDLIALQKMVEAISPRRLIPIHTFEGHSYKNHFNVPVIEIQDGVPFIG